MGRLFPLLRWISGSLRSPLTGKRQFIEGRGCVRSLERERNNNVFGRQARNRLTGCDLNPVMIIIARARFYPRAKQTRLCHWRKTLSKASELIHEHSIRTIRYLWFNRPTASAIRALERRIRHQLVGERTVTTAGLKLENISGIAATFYVSLFSVLPTSNRTLSIV